MSVNSFLNVAGWGAAYGASLYGAGLTVTSVGRMAATGFNTTWNGVVNRSFDATKISTEMKKELSDFAEGIAYCVGGLLARQVVARTFSETPPDFIVKGIENLGWKHVSSPVIQRVVDYINLYSPFPITLL